MFARLPVARKAAIRFFALMSMLWVVACEPVAMGAPGTGAAPRPGDPVQVALLVPRGSGEGSDTFLSQNLENAARLAIADLQGVTIDLRVYETAANPARAAAAATRAADEGAQIILGPLYAEAANAAGVAVAGRGINVLAFSNNPSIAGGNVFILGSTFRNTADRLVRYGRNEGISRYMVVHSDDLQGSVGRDAATAAVRAAGATVAGVESYPLSQQGITGASGRIASAIRAAGADAILMTASVNADLPILATALPEQGIDPAVTRYMGLTRWNATPQALSLPGLQGGLFAQPDQRMTAAFESRYAAAYGEQPHPLAGLAYDGIAAIGALVSQGNRNALSRAALTQASGFQGTGGVFRLLPDGTNERGLAVATVRNNQVVILEQAPRRFGGAGF
jgi:hypothetical protein